MLKERLDNIVEDLGWVDSYTLNVDEKSNSVRVRFIFIKDVCPEDTEFDILLFRMSSLEDSLKTQIFWDYRIKFSLSLLFRRFFVCRKDQRCR